LVQQARRVQAESAWAGSAWAGLVWAGSVWEWSVRVGSAWAELGQAWWAGRRLSWCGLGQRRPCRHGLGRRGLSWWGVGQRELSWCRHGGHRLSWRGLDQFGLSFCKLSRRGLRLVQAQWMQAELVQEQPWVLRGLCLWPQPSGPVCRHHMRSLRYWYPPCLLSHLRCHVVISSLTTAQ
jgi:hypothetical protein